MGATNTADKQLPARAQCRERGGREIVTPSIMQKTYDDKFKASVLLMLEAAGYPETDVREIPGFPGYAISRSGVVWSFRKRGLGRGLSSTPLQLRQFCIKNYKMVNLYDVDGIMSQMSIGRLLLMAFVSPPPSNNAFTRFLDGNGANTALDNLMWYVPEC
jgi:hypothetical protein